MSLTNRTHHLLPGREVELQSPRVDGGEQQVLVMVTWR